MNFLLFILLSFVSVYAAPFDKWQCSSQISKLTQEWKASGEWIKQDMSGLDSFFFSSPTNKVGEWVLVRKTPKGVGVAKANQTGRIEASFETADCQPKIKPFTNAAVDDELFTDKKLSDYIQKNQTGIIYVWSPRMNLSEDGLKEIKQAASSEKKSLLILLAKDISEKEYAQLKAKLGAEVTQRVDSFEFKMRSVDQHYPAVLSFKNGTINPRIKHGYEKASGYVRDINELLGK